MKPSNAKITRAFDLLAKTQAQIKRIENPKKLSDEEMTLLKEANTYLDGAVHSLSTFNKGLAKKCGDGGKRDK
jgi:hypothetical protein